MRRGCGYPPRVTGFTQSSDVWTMVDGGNTWTFTELTAELSLSVSTSGYTSWASTSGLTGANNGATHDPEFDGIENVLECMLGGDPLASDTSILPELTTDATHFIFTFNREDAPEAEVTLTFQHGSNLSGWTDVAIGADNGSSDSEVEIVEDGLNADVITVTIPKGANTELFGRLRALK